MSKKNGDEGSGGLLQAAGTQESSGSMGSGGLLQAAGSLPGGRSTTKLNEEHATAIEMVVGRRTFDEMCILFPLISRCDGEDWIERIRYSRNFWYHIPGKCERLPKVKGPQAEHLKEFLPFTGRPLPWTYKATEGMIQYWIWYLVEILLTDSALWFRCKQSHNESISIWNEKKSFPSTFGHCMDAPLGVEADGQQLHLGNRDLDHQHSKRWKGLVSGCEVVGSGRRLPTAGSALAGPTGSGCRLPAARSGVQEISDEESTSTQFGLPTQYAQSGYRDAQVPLSAGPTDTAYTSTNPVERRGAWCGYFIRLVEATMRLVGIASRLKPRNRPKY